MKNYTYEFIKYLCENNLIKITDIQYDHIKRQITIYYIELNSSERITTITLPSYYLENIYEIMNTIIFPDLTITKNEDLDMILDFHYPSDRILYKIFTILEDNDLKPKYYRYFDNSAILTFDNNHIHMIKDTHDLIEHSDLLEYILDHFTKPINK